METDTSPVFCLCVIPSKKKLSRWFGSLIKPIFYDKDATHHLNEQRQKLVQEVTNGFLREVERDVIFLVFRKNNLLFYEHCKKEAGLIV